MTTHKLLVIAAATPAARAEVEALAPERLGPGGRQGRGWVWGVWLHADDLDLLHAAAALPGVVTFYARTDWLDELGWADSSNDTTDEAET
jgi:hypothetical protein